ncbi:MAG: polyprenyl synthetase family protein [bacterium]
MMFNIDQTIKKILSLAVAKKSQALVKYQIEAGGKRIRPDLAILTCLAAGGRLKDALYPAAGLEILHNYTLIVDDIIDNGVLRRGKKTTWANYGKSIAECIGADYAASIFQAANRSNNPVKISELFSRTLKEIVDGEIADILFEQSGREEEPYVRKNRYFKITEKDYFKMIDGKTASLIGAACEAGGIAAKANQKNINLLKNYGFNLGLAFQIQDDILDIFGQEKVFGKKVGKDIVERKLGNIVILSALKEFNAADRIKFLKILEKREKKDSDIREAIRLIGKTNSRQRADTLKENFIKKAQKILALLPQNKWSKALKNFANFVIQREK